MSNTRARSFDEAAGVTAIRHPTLVNVSRIFPSDATMNIVYDWVGSLPPYPLYFKLCNFVCNCAQPSETVSKYTLSILNVVEIEEGLPFEESQEISCPGFNMDIQSHRQADILTNIEKRRLAKREELTLNGSPDKQKKITVRRQNILEDMFSLYETLNTEELSHITFEKESEYGDGVMREVYSQFFKELFALKSSGVESNVPYSLTVTEARTLGKLMTHAFIQSNFFPLNFAKATFEYLARCTVRDSSLIESFLFFIQKNERTVFTNFLDKKSESFSLEDKDIIWHVLFDCGVSAIPNPTNIKELVLQAARAVFVEKPCFTLLHILEGLGNIFKSLG